MCTVQQCNEQPKISVSWYSLPYRLDLQGSCRPVSWFWRCFLSSSKVFCCLAIEVTAHNPLLPGICDFWSQLCSFFLHCGVTVLMCSAPWVSFLAERQQESFSSSALFAHFPQFIPVPVWLHVLPQPSCCSSHWWHRAGANRLYPPLGSMQHPEPALWPWSNTQRRLKMRTKHLQWC